MTRPARGPWSAVLVERPGGYGVLVRLDVTYSSREAAVEAGQALLAQMDARLEPFGQRLAEAAIEPLAEVPRTAPTPTFRPPPD